MQILGDVQKSLARNDLGITDPAAQRELVRLEVGGPVHRTLFEAALDFIDRRLDCADFVLHGVLRLLYQFGDDPRLPAELLDRARASGLPAACH